MCHLIWTDVDYPVSTPVSSKPQCPYVLILLDVYRKQQGKADEDLQETIAKNPLDSEGAGTVFFCTGLESGIFY